jgi:hypothetical protein
MTPTEFQVLSARIDRLERRHEALSALVGSPADVGKGRAMSLDDALAISENTFDATAERKRMDDTPHGIHTERWVSPHVTLLRNLADLIESGDRASIGRHVPKVLHELAASIARDQAGPIEIKRSSDGGI